VVCTAIILILREYRGFLLVKSDLVTQQWVSFTRQAKTDERLVFLAMDPPTLTLDPVHKDEIEASRALQLIKEGFPWSREVYGLIAEQLIQAGAKAVVFDVILPFEREGDEAFKKILDKYPNQIVIGFDFPEKSTATGTQQTLQRPAPSLIPNTGGDDSRMGFVTLFPDPDMVVRHLWFRRSFTAVMGLQPVIGETVYESLSARGLRQAGFGDRIPADSAPHMINYAWAGSVKERSSLEPHSLHEIFTYVWKQNYGNGAFFRDKIVLVGPLGNWGKDYTQTPFGQVPGPLIHLNAMNAMLTGEFLHEAPFWLNRCLIAAGGAVAFLLGFFIRQVRPRVVLLAAAIAGWVGLTIWLYSIGWVVLVFSPALALVSSSVAFLIVEYRGEQLERTRVRKILEGYVSRDVVREVLDNPKSFLNTLGGERRKITILFSDVRGFTTITEYADPAKLVAQLNEYFTEMVRIVFAHSGTVDKFIGDAVMAHWGGVSTHGESIDACHAVSTSLEMLQALDRLNEDWRKRGAPEFHIGIGLNHGDVIFGHLGSVEKHDLTAVGDPVNTASRLESATKQLHTPLLLGASVAPLVQDRFRLRTVDLLQLKGKSAPIEVFTVLGERAGTPDPEWLVVYETGVRLYRQRDFSEAVAHFEKVLTSQPADELAKEYLRRCTAYQEVPPPSGWDGVFVMMAK